MASHAENDQTAVYRTRLLAVVGVIASSIGVVGFVTVVGGMVVWIRFQALHLPADTVVAAIPRTDLIVIGLSTLIPFIVLGLVSAFLAYLFAADNFVPSRPLDDLGRRWTGITGLSLDAGPAMSASGGAGLLPSADGIGSLQVRLTQIAEAARDRAATAQAAANVGQPKAASNQIARINDLSDMLKRDYEWLAEADRSKQELCDLELHLKQTKRTVAAAQKRAKRARRHAKQRQTRVLVTLIGVTLGLLAVEFCIVFIAGAPSHLQVLMLVAIGLGLALGTLLLGWRTRGFVVFGAAIFVSVLLFGTATTLFRTYHNPKVQPVAVLRAGRDRGLTGYFVAETSDRVYLVRTAGEYSDASLQIAFPRMVVIPRNDIVAMEVGPLDDQKIAYDTSYLALRELCAQRIVEAQRVTRYVAADKATCGQRN
jgi:hypothetical protein